jgi:hypothetical protein
MEALRADVESPDTDKVTCESTSQRTQTHRTAMMKHSATRIALFDLSDELLWEVGKRLDAPSAARASTAS